jgi:putative ABC transport system permease protein
MWQILNKFHGMEAVRDISWLSLFLGLCLLVIPIGLMWYYRTGIAMQGLTAALRMTLQLFLVGLYLEFLFELNSAWVNILWMLLMFVVASFAVINRNGFRFRTFFIPVFTGMAMGVVPVAAFFLMAALKLDEFFDPRYFIPITGMVTGNCMERNILALNAYYNQLVSSGFDYRFALSAGASRGEALRPYMSSALRQAFNPLIAQMAVMGLISLPGTMTGQILGGSNPSDAIRYQIMIVIAIFVATVIAVTATVMLANLRAFDSYDNLKGNIRAKKSLFSAKH